MKYRAEIDGLRAVAVLPVVAYHAGLSMVSGGFAGVDVFFVISGFLITSIIAEEAEVGRFSIGRFYERRARRILPALFFVMLVTIIMSWQVMVPYQLEDLSQSVVATLLFVSNILFWFEADYFAVEAAYKPLLHTWSLAVEEQFYVIFPLLLVVLYRVGQRSVVPVLAAGFVLSCALALGYGHSNSSAAFFMIQFRAWELLAGALAALWIRNAPPAPSPWLAMLGFAAIMVSFFVVDERTAWPGALTLMPVLGTVALLVFARADAGVGRALALEPVRFTGLISYSLYLCHLPPLALLNIYYYGDVPALASGAAVLLASVTAWLSWRFVERPFRVSSGVKLIPFVVIMVATLVVLMTFGVFGSRTNGFQALMMSRIPAEYAGRVIDREAEIREREAIWGPILVNAGRPFDSDDNRHKVLILGDSLSGDLMVATGGHAKLFPGSVFRRVRLDDRCMGDMTALIEDGQSLATEGSRCAREIGKLNDADLIEAADEIVLAANWQLETVEDGTVLANALAGKDKRVSILGVAAFNDMASLSMRLHRLDEPVESFLFRNIRSKFSSINAYLQDAASGVPRVRYLDKLHLYCDAASESCDMLDGRGKLVIFDSAHVTVEGVDIMSRRIAKDRWFK